jgi:surface protein
MRKNLLLISFIILTTKLFAQQTTFVPDDNFEAYLESQGLGDGVPNNDLVFTTNIETETTLNISGRGITDLTGLEDFTDLVELLAQNNNGLTSLDPAFGLENLQIIRAFDCFTIDGIMDFTLMSNLREVGLDNNVIDGIQFDSGNTALEILDIKDNQLTLLELPNNPPLEQLIIANNQLSGSLDISSFYSTLTDFWACGNPNLSCIQVNSGDLVGLQSNLSSSSCSLPPSNNTLVDGLLIDPNTTFFSPDCSADYVLVPDDAFEQALIDFGIDSEGAVSGILDDRILRTDAEAVTDELNLTGEGQGSIQSYEGVFFSVDGDMALGIADLTGLEAFINVEVLYIQGNSSTSSNPLTNTFSILDLSGNSSLRQLFAFNNPNLTTVNFNGLNNLFNIGLNNCSIQTLDVSTNTAMRDINISGQVGASLQSINFGAITSVTDLQAHSNSIVELDISNFDTQLVSDPDPNDGGPDPAFRVFSNPLTCILVSDITNAIAQTALDTGGEGNNWQVPNGDGNPDTSLFKEGNCAFTPTLDDFVITVRTDNPGSSGDTEFEIPTTGGGYNYNVNWGDGSTDTAVNGNITHTYATTGTYTITIRDNTGLGTGFPRIYFNDQGDKDKLISIDQWGTGNWSSMAQAFFGCTNVVQTATDTPNLSSVTSMEQMFNLARVFNGDLSGWDVSTVLNMRAMLAGAWQFNQPIGSWNTTNVNNMSEMFFDAERFNQSLGSWDVSNVTTMQRMFSGADAFNQDISLWNTSNVVNMEQMFIDADVFNQDITNWDTSSVTDMSQMFRGATAFDQNLGGWNIVRVTTMENMLNNSTGGLSQSNYDATLIGWAGQTVQNGVSLGANNLRYCDGNLARTILICENNWTISGDIIDCSAIGCTPVRFADNNLRNFLLNTFDANLIRDALGNAVNLNLGGEICLERASQVDFLDLSGLAITSLMGSCIDPNNPLNSTLSPDAANPDDPTNGLIAFSNLTELRISNNNFDNGLQVPNVSLERLIANNCIQDDIGATWTASVGNPSFYLNNVTYFEFQDNFTNVAPFDVNFEGLNNVTSAILSGTNLSGLEITPTIWNQLVSLTYENTNALRSITGLQNAVNLEELLINGSKYAGVLDLTGLTTFRVLQADDNDITSIIVSSSPDLEAITANRNISLTTVELPTNGNGMLGLFLDDNDISEIDISGVDQTLTIADPPAVFSILNNANLTCIKVSDVDEAILRTNVLPAYAIPNSDTSVFTELDCDVCTPVIINDVTLRNFLLNNTFEDINGDFISIAQNGVVCRELAETIVTLDINSIGVSDITGLEAFTSLRIFTAFGNSTLTSLQPIEGLVTLEEIRAFGCNLDGVLDFSAMPNLNTVGLDNNEIDGILFNQNNTVLRTLDIKNNELSQLLLPTSNPVLERLILANNQLTGNLDLRDFTATLNHFWSCGNLLLECIQINQSDFDNLSSRLSSSTCSNPPSANNQVNGWLADDVNLFKVDCNAVFTVNIEATDPDDAEASLDPGLFTISLDRANNTGADLVINYSVAGSATSGLDYQPIASQGTVTIGDGQTTATITITPIDDGEVEPLETVEITLLADVAYTIGTSMNAIVNITDNDSPGITVDPNTDLETSEDGTTATFTVVLNTEPITDVVLDISSTVPVEATVAPEQITFTPANWDTPIEITVTGMDDTEIDGDQNYLILIAVNQPLSDDSYDSVPTVSLSGTNLDNDVDTNTGPNLSNTAFTVQVLSNACPDSNPPTGSITVATQEAGFTFDVSFENQSSGTLTNSVSWTLENLAPDTYEVCLSLSDFPDWQRCFSVAVEALQEVALNGFTTLMAKESVDLNLSGSSRYTVNVNGELFNFNSVNGTAPTVVQVPITKGVNYLTISGESQCQGIISQQVVFGEALVFPNPVTDELRVIGLPVEGDVEVLVFDYSGRIAKRGKKEVVGGALTMELGTMETGTYIMVLEGSDWTQEFKILKQ